MSFGSVSSYLTGGVVNPQTPNYAGLAGGLEKSRQNQINQGLQAINAIYNGGSYPIYASAKGATATPGTDYFKYSNKQGYTPYSPKMKKGTGGATLGGGKTIGKGISKGGPPVPKGKLGKNIYAGTQSPYYTGFNQNFYDKAANDYINYAVPQVAQQYDTTNRDIQYGLANRGLFGSSAQSQANTNLNLAVGQQEQQIADNARTTATNLQQQVQGSEQNAINNLYQSADPAGAASQAVGTAAQFQVPQTFQPILNAFGGIANQYATSLLLNNYTPSAYGAGGAGGGASYGAGNPYSGGVNWSQELGPTQQ
jgi:hypothetical protein